MTKNKKEPHKNTKTLDLKLGDIVTPVVDLVDFSAGIDYKVRNAGINPSILFIVSNSNRVINISLLAPMLWSKVEY